MTEARWLKQPAKNIFFSFFSFVYFVVDLQILVEGQLPWTKDLGHHVILHSVLSISKVLTSSFLFIYLFVFTPFKTTTLYLCNDKVAEWSECWIASIMGSVRVGSNPILFIRLFLWRSGMSFVRGISNQELLSHKFWIRANLTMYGKISINAGNLHRRGGRVVKALDC